MASMYVYIILYQLEVHAYNKAKPFNFQIIKNELKVALKVALKSS